MLAPGPCGSSVVVGLSSVTVIISWNLGVYHIIIINQNEYIKK